MSVTKLAMLCGLGAGLAGIGGYGVISAPHVSAAAPLAAAEEKHPVREALDDLRNARKLLESVDKEKEKDVNDHRKQAMDGILLAIDQLEMATGEKPDHHK